MNIFIYFCFCFIEIIMHQLVKQTDAIWLLQLVISSPLIHALGDPNQAPTRIQTPVPRLRGGWLTKWAIPPPKKNENIYLLTFIYLLMYNLHN